MSPLKRFVKRSHLFAIASLLTLSSAAYWSFAGKPAAAACKPIQVPDSMAVGTRYRDLAVACLTMGSLSPPAEELGPALFDSIAEPIARVLEMHMEADFDSYLQAHRRHLVWANDERARDVGTLKLILANDFGIAEDSAPDQWVAGLRLFWSLLYTEPVLQELDPASSRLEYHVAHFDIQAGDPDLTEYERSFEDRRFSFPTRINNEMALPHRRAPEEIARKDASLTWFDFQVDVTLGRKERFPGGILLRFVWDGLDEEWFLSRAVTIYPDHFDLRSSRCVMLF